MITVHHARRARSVRVIWLLEELALPYEVKPIEFKRDSLRSSEYLKLHPLGQIPVIEDGDVTLFESGAIVQYLLDRYGEGRLVPAVGASWTERAAYLQWFHFGEGSLAKYVNEIVRHRFGEPESERVPAVLGQTRERLRTALSVVDRALAGRDFICGAEFTAADIMVSYALSMSRIVGELPAEFSAVHAYLGRLKDRPAYARAWAS